MTRILTPRLARTLYNVADALAPDEEADAATVDVLPAVERSLRHAGPGAIRRSALLLRLIEWHPLRVLDGRGSFSTRPQAVRRAWLARVARGVATRGAFAELAARIRSAREASARASETPRASGSGPG